MYKLVVLSFTLFLITGCKPDYYKVENTPEQHKQDKLECKLEAAKVSGYDWIDAASNKREVENLCLETRGYTREIKKK